MIHQTIHPKATSPKETSGQIKCIWAQQKLLSLEGSSSSSRDIIQHCRRYGLVSDYTSLIVLERFRDYVEFDIPPPEPDIRRKWQIAYNKAAQNQSQSSRIQRAWNEKARWHKRKFSWLPHTLIAACQQTDLWIKAIDTAFTKEDIDQQTRGIIQNWKQKAENTVRQQPLSLIHI